MASNMRVVRTISVDNDIFEAFKKYCKERKTNVSAELERMMAERLKLKMEGKEIDIPPVTYAPAAKQVTTVSLDVNLLVELDKIAAELKISRSELISQLIGKALKVIASEKNVKKCPICKKEVKNLRLHLVERHEKNIKELMRSQNISWNEAVNYFINLYFATKK